jgi:hypothetical protein
MTLINGNQLVIVRIVHFYPHFHKLPHIAVTSKTYENRGLSALSALLRFSVVAL